ncbi:hypothetical protein [Longitalea luteola]|uniref:hypothetical protein n=1 Tax=Longitalea luteola TaxID=2812563 RepID=UPI001A959933|nr:hypothetical protein [Longitalea luteola]
METVTLTKLYEVLAQKIGRSEAECLTHYVDVKVKTELCNKLEILATKEDIHALRNEMKDNIISMQKWMLGTFITLVVMILGLYAAILLKP